MTMEVSLYNFECRIVLISLAEDKAIIMVGEMAITVEEMAIMVEEMAIMVGAMGKEIVEKRKVKALVDQMESFVPDKIISKS